MGTRKEIADEIEKLGSHLSNTSLTITIQNKGSAIPGFTCSFIRYQATQAFRIAGWLRQDHVEDTDLVAHATRGLFESHLIFGHLMKDGGASFMDLLIKEVAADHFDILKSIAPEERDLKDKPNEFRELYENLKNQNLKKTPNTRELAKENGAEEEYKKYYSHLSKYSHPSAYQIAGDYREVYSQHAIMLFASRAKIYLEAIIQSADGIRDIVLQHNQDNNTPQTS